MCRALKEHQSLLITEPSPQPAFVFKLGWCSAWGKALWKRRLTFVSCSVLSWLRVSYFHEREGSTWNFHGLSWERTLLGKFTLKFWTRRRSESKCLSSLNPRIHRKVGGDKKTLQMSSDLHSCTHAVAYTFPPDIRYTHIRYNNNNQTHGKFLSSQPAEVIALW